MSWASDAVGSFIERKVLGIGLLEDRVMTDLTKSGNSQRTLTYIPLHSLALNK